MSEQPMTLLQAYLSNPRTRRVLSKKPGQAGFSLIELVVVIAVLAILAVVALPNFTGVTNSASAQAMKTGLSDIFKQCEVMRARQTPLANRLVDPPLVSEVTFAPLNGGGQITCAGAANTATGSGTTAVISAVPTTGGGLVGVVPSFAIGSGNGVKYCNQVNDYGCNTVTNRW